jgi:hypothetical protein
VQSIATIGEAEIADPGRKSWTTLAIQPRFTQHDQGCRRGPIIWAAGGHHFRRLGETGRDVLGGFMPDEGGAVID